MENALTEIHAFVRAIPPFEHLSEDQLEQLLKAINICYVRAQQELPPEGEQGAKLYIVRKGALSYFQLPERVDHDHTDQKHSDREQQLLGKYGEGDLCTVFCYPEESKTIRVVCEEDCLLYSIDFALLKDIIVDLPQVKAFFQQSPAQRLSQVLDQANQNAILNSSLLNTNVSDFYHTPVATIESNATIQQAAITMTEQNFSCLVVVDAGKTAGIITDKDIRRRCVAQGLSIVAPVSEIMTRDITTLSSSQSAFDALMLMTSLNIHHLPVTHQGKLAGMVTITDLMRQEEQNAVNLTSLIHKANSIVELKKLSALLPKLQVKMATLGASASQLGKTVSAITTAITIRLIALAEQKYGAAPVPYVWVAAGSQARQEQFAHSDQDNGLIISDRIQPEHEPWFANLATYVCDGLAQCGFVYCPGEIMATTKHWRQPQKRWLQYFNTWINTPDPKALLHCSIFFDLTAIYGDTRLLEDIRSKVLSQTKQSSLFIAHLSKNALQLKPPLGFFRDFVLIQDGKNKASLDLKHNGIAPIVDLARIYALSEGISAVNTRERLQKVAGTRAVTKASAKNLLDAFEFLSMLKMKHQAEQISQQQAPDNYLSPKSLSKLEREHLKDAFKVIKTLQESRQSVY